MDQTEVHMGRGGGFCSSAGEWELQDGLKGGGLPGVATDANG